MDRPTALLNRVFPYAAAFAALTLLFAATHAPVLFERKIYMNPWIFRNHAPFPPAAASEINPLNTSSDFLTHYFPYKYFIQSALQDRALPLWNPEAFGGIPLWANGSSAVFSPFNLLLWRYDPYRAYAVVLIFLFLGGPAMLFHYLKRYLRLSALAAFTGAACLMLCPFLAEYIDGDTWLIFLFSFPAILIACGRYHEDGDGARLVRRAALILFATALLGHIHVIINTVFLFTVYLLVVGGFRKNFTRTFPLVLVTGALFLGLAGFILYPIVVFFGASQWLSAGEYHLVLNVPLSPVVSIYPAIIKAPYFGRAMEALQMGFVRWNSETPYVGVIPFLLAFTMFGAAWFKRAARPVFLFAALVLLYYVVLSVIVPWPFFYLFFQKFWQVYILASCVLCAAAVDAFFADAGFRAAVRRVVTVFLGAIVAPATLGAILLYFFPGWFERALASVAQSLSPLEEPSFQARFTEMFGLMRQTLSIQSSFMFLPPVFCAGLLGLGAAVGKKGAPAERTLKIVLCAMILADLLIMGGRLRPEAVPAERARPRSEAMEFLKRDPGLFRTMSIQTEAVPGEGPQRYVLKPNLGHLYGLHDVGGQDSALNGAYVYFARKYLSGHPETVIDKGGILDFTDLNTDVASLLNVKYVLAGPERRLGKDLRKVFTGEGLVIYENPNVLPRLFFTRRVRVEPDARQMFGKIYADEISSEPIVYVDGAVPFLEAAAGSAPVPVEIKRHKPGDVRVTLESADYGLLVFTDNWDPGWKATDNGQPVPIRRVDGIFKGVFLSPGKHEIQFTYLPDFLIPGIALAVLTLAGIFLYWQRDRQKYLLDVSSH